MRRKLAILAVAVLLSALTIGCKKNNNFTEGTANFPEMEEVENAVQETNQDATDFEETPEESIFYYEEAQKDVTETTSLDSMEASEPMSSTEENSIFAETTDELKPTVTIPQENNLPGEDLGTMLPKDEF